MNTVTMKLELRDRLRMTAPARVGVTPARVDASATQGDGVYRRLAGWLVAFYALLLMPLAALAEDADLASLFSRAGVEGTLVIAPLQDGDAFVHNDRRARQQFTAASTFKILNALIALEEGVITSDATLKWDGVSRGIPDWNHDQTLESAFRTSCVWCFQALARRIGSEGYRRYLTDLHYGELRLPFEETTFWLDGSLTISADEQVRFLKQIHRRTLPFSTTSYDTLARIMLVEATPNYTLRAKSGWATDTRPQVGWYVGYVETARGVWAFALNLDTRDRADLPLRQAMVLEALRAKGIIE
jgi:beta-lactamase class D